MKIKTPSLITGLLVLALFACLASGCATSSLVSNKSDRLKGPYKKIFIAIHGDIRTSPFTEPWMDNISKEFQDRNILLKTYDIPDQDKNPLSLQSDSANNELNAQINEFQPEVVMIIALRKIEAYGGVQIGRPGSNGGTFDMKLFEPGDSHTPIWRANMKVWGEYGISLAVKKGTQTFISKLEQDNIIIPKN
jgi:hypothetical protein